jgi:hypothetical protein
MHTGSDPSDELIERTKLGARHARQAAELNRRMAHAYADRASGFRVISSEILRDYAAALSEEAASCEALADAVQAEIASRETN